MDSIVEGGAAGLTTVLMPGTDTGVVGNGDVAGDTDATMDDSNASGDGYS